MATACDEKRSCTTGSDVCVNNYCQSACADSGCREGLTCDGGYCKVKCEISDDCLLEYSCENNVCQPIEIKEGKLQ